MKKWFRFALLSISLSFGYCQADDIDTLLIFGDSYSDIGAGNAVAEQLGLNKLASPTPPFFNGIHSNGFNWSNYTTQNLDLEMSNFAVSGAETGTQNALFSDTDYPPPK